MSSAVISIAPHAWVPASRRPRPGKPARRERRRYPSGPSVPSRRTALPQWESRCRCHRRRNVVGAPHQSGSRHHHCVCAEDIPRGLSGSRADSEEGDSTAFEASEQPGSPVVIWANRSIGRKTPVFDICLRNARPSSATTGSRYFRPSKRTEDRLRHAPPSRVSRLRIFSSRPFPVVTSARPSIRLGGGACARTGAHPLPPDK